jgi:hypothetical protein
MKAFKIIDIKDFMNNLLLGENFDSFWVTEATITTFCTFSIDGTLHPDFFDTDNQKILEESGVHTASWKHLRSFCYSVIRGKQTPLSFKIVFQLPASQAASLIQKHGLTISPDLVSGFFLNLQYKNRELTCITGTSLKTFLMDRSAEQLWDSLVPDFLRGQKILFEEI